MSGNLIQEEYKNIIYKIKESIEELYKNDYELFSYQTNDPLICERTLTFRLGLYLQKLFKDYNVDCEYNRHLDKIKKIEDADVYPDIIIHNRKNDENNLVWIEVKKSNNSSKVDANSDRKRLCYVTKEEPYHYKYGIFIMLDKDIKNTFVEIYQVGKKLTRLSL